MGKRRTNGLRGCLFLLLVVGCLLATGGGWAASELPRWATREIGPVSLRHGWVQRVVLAAQLYLHRYDLQQPLDVFADEREFVISPGESPILVAQRLEQERFIRSGDALRTYLVYSGFDTTLQAGSFQLSPAWNAMEIAAQMQDATPEDVSFHLLAGWRLEEVAAALPLNGVQIDPEAFIEAVRNPTNSPLGFDWPIGLSLEGYLFPGEYTLKRESSLEEVVDAFFSRFFEQVTPELRDAFNQQGLDLHQAVTLASIIEREAMVEAEMPMIASVFLNRLAIEMKLDTDPSVQYALGYQAGRGGWWTNPLSLTDLQTDSPYNTYIYRGLPPGPIANPSLAALQAVAQPEQSPFYYFRATCDGSGLHNFSQTFEEHVQKACP